MATKAEMDAFHADQIHLKAASFKEVAALVIGSYSLESRDEAVMRDLFEGRSKPLSLNWMFRDKENRFIWITGDETRKHPTLTYLKSEWPSGQEPGFSKLNASQA